MNNTALRLRDTAWSKMETLTNMKQFIQHELGHSQSFLPTDSIEKLKRTLRQIDSFNTDVFELIRLANEEDNTTGLELKLDELSAQYDCLMQDVEAIFGE